MKPWLNSALQTVGAIASIVGVVVLFAFDNSMRGTVALLVIIGFLLLGYRQFLRFLNSFLQQGYPHGYENISSVMRYHTADGNNIEYDIFKTIQCKQPFMSQYVHKFGWTGTEAPKDISSLFQKVGKVTRSDTGEYDRLNLTFKTPLKYNEATVIHVKFPLNDADHKSHTHVEAKVEDPTRLLHWRIELRHLASDYDKHAELLRRKIHSEISADYEAISSIAFDKHKQTKAFEFVLPDPEVGYFYQLRWSREA